MLDPFRDAFHQAALRGHQLIGRRLVVGRSQIGTAVVDHEHQGVIGAGEVEHRVDDMLGQHLRVRLGDLGLQAPQRMTDALLRLHLSEQVQPHRDQFAGAEEVLGIVFLDSVGRLDQVVGKDLETEGELSKFFDRVGSEPHGGTDDGPHLDFLFIAHRGDEMSDPGLADTDGFLATLEEIGIVVERARLALLQ